MISSAKRRCYENLLQYYALHRIGFHIEVIEAAVGKKAKKEMMEMQPGDVPATYADIDDLARDVGFSPATPIEKGVARFVEWYRGYYKV